MNKSDIITLSNLLQISECTTKEELENLKNFVESNCNEEDKPIYLDYIDFKLQLLNTKKAKEIENEKIKEDIDLIEGEYYYLWLSDEKQFTVPIRKTKDDTQNIVYEELPVVAICDDRRLYDLISHTRFTLNPIITYRNSNNHLIDHAVRLKRDDLYKEAKLLHELHEDEKEKYKDEVKKQINKNEMSEEEFKTIEEEIENSEYDYNTHDYEDKTRSTFVEHIPGRIKNNKSLHGMGIF